MGSRKASPGASFRQLRGYVLSAGKFVVVLVIIFTTMRRHRTKSSSEVNLDFLDYIDLGAVR